MGIRRTILNVLKVLNLDMKNVTIDDNYDEYISIAIPFEHLKEFIEQEEGYGSTINYEKFKGIVDLALPEDITVTVSELNEKLFLDFAMNDEQRKLIKESWGL